ncbi:MAG: LacI family DNA-binding transcriptional regulator [Bacillota bacterium]
MPRLKDIAVKANVSIAMVSRVFNNSGYVAEEKRRAVLDAANELGYQPPDNPKRNYEKLANDIVGVVVPDINNPFFSEAIKGMIQVFRRSDINILICDTDESPEMEIQSLQTLRREKVGGIIITPVSGVVEYNAEYLKEFNSLGIPIVLLDRDIKLSGFDGVFLDSFRSSTDAVQTLIDHGHTEIAIIAGLITSKPGIDRLEGYLEALRLNNIPIKEEYILYGDFKKDSAYEQTYKLLETRKKVTAIFSSNNLMSVGCYEAIIDFGLKIPDDISLISFDDFYFFGTRSFNISAVSRPTMQMGVEAAKLLVDHIKKGKKQKDQMAKRIILTPHLILRGSELFPRNRQIDK